MKKPCDVALQGALTVALCALSATAVAGVPADLATRVAQTPEKAWQVFLDTAEAEPTYTAYQVLRSVGYTAAGVDAAGCKTHRDALADAVRTVPVSLAIRRSAMLCAEALGDSQTADHELAALTALSKLAWSQVSEVALADPIRIVHPIDAYALLSVSGLQYRYDYYLQVQPSIHMPIAVAAWDPEAGVERLLKFDAVDTAFRIERESQYAGYPYQRRVYADAFMQGRSAGGEYMAADLEAVRAAAQLPLADRVAVLRPAARLGGINSGMYWLATCIEISTPECGDGFVDTWLPQAEQRYVMAMVMVAFAYAHGIGVEADASMAADLLDAANQLTAHDAATESYARLSLAASAAPLPARLVERLHTAQGNGNPDARWLLIKNHIRAAGHSPLDAASVAYLQRPEVNSHGAGFWLLAGHYDALKDTQAFARWRERAAEAGHADAQAAQAFFLLEQDGQESGRPAAMRLMLDAARGDSIVAQRYLAYRASSRGQWGEAEAWLMDAVAGGDIETILQLASLYEQEPPGIDGNLERAITVYRALAKEADVAEARRRLAALALAGKGMERNPEQARQWLLTDAEAGDLQSQTLLGLSYLSGEFGAPDKQAGMRWLQRALDAGSSVAQLEFGNWLYYRSDAQDARTRALGFWRLAHAQGEALATNNLAWAYCTSPDPAIYDPGKGMQVVDGIGAGSDLSAAVLDTIAACHAANGDFERAQEYQARAIELVSKRNRANADQAGSESDGSLEGFRNRMKRYQADKRYIEQADS